MANIDTYLQDIMSARYGKDVRQAIHDALYAMNQEIMTGGVHTFNERYGDVIPTTGDYDISQITASNSRTGQIPVVNNQGKFTLTDGPDKLSNLSDVEFTSPTTGQILKYNGVKWVNGNESGGGGGGGTSDYTDLLNKPQINGVTLSGNKTSNDLGIVRTIVEDFAPNSSETYRQYLNRLWITMSNSNLGDIIVLKHYYSGGNWSRIYTFNGLESNNTPRYRFFMIQGLKLTTYSMVVDSTYSEYNTYNPVNDTYTYHASDEADSKSRLTIYSIE